MHREQIYSGSTQPLAVVVFQKALKGNKFASQQTKSNGKWTKKENELYLAFLQENKLYFTTSTTRKCSRIFRKMSQLIQDRTPQQCRSHHQKYEKSSNYQYDKLLEVVQAKIKRLQKKEAKSPEQDKSDISLNDTCNYEPKLLRHKRRESSKEDIKQNTKESSKKRKYEIWSCLRIFLDIQNIGTW